MNTESELYKAGHPSTWSIGDVIRNESYGAIVKITGWEDREDGKFIGTLVEASNSAIGPIPKGGAWDGDFTRADYVLIRRANQQENKVESPSDYIDQLRSGPCYGPKLGDGPKPEDCIAPVIEQKPICFCCTIQAGTSEDLDPIRHNDPCIYSASERYMLPIAKAQFRERQKELKAEQERQNANEASALSLFVHEQRIFNGSKLNAGSQGLINESNYSRLTGHKFE